MCVQNLDSVVHFVAVKVELFVINPFLSHEQYRLKKKKKLVDFF